MLFIFSGLPATGKTTLAQALARNRSATYLRIDTIERKLGRKNREDIGPAGYIIAYELAADNLKLGSEVVADSVNSIEITRSAWRDVAIKNGHHYIEIEVTCTDTDEHKRRVTQRLMKSHLANLPTWSEVINREYENWTPGIIKIDTAGSAISETTTQLLSLVNERVRLLETQMQQHDTSK